MLALVSTFLRCQILHPVSGQANVELELRPSISRSCSLLVEKLLREKRYPRVERGRRRCQQRVDTEGACRTRLPDESGGECRRAAPVVVQGVPLHAVPWIGEGTAMRVFFCTKDPILGSPCPEAQNQRIKSYVCGDRNTSACTSRATFLVLYVI